MSDAALKNAIAKRDEAAAKINKLQAEIDELKKKLASAERFIFDWKMYAGIPMSRDSGVESSDTPAPKERNPGLDIIRKHARRAIESAGKPIPRRALKIAMKEQNLTIAGKNPLMVLSTMMWRMQDEFVRIPGYGYWFRHTPYPPASYTPGDIPDTRTKAEDETQDKFEEALD